MAEEKTFTCDCVHTIADLVDTLTAAEDSLLLLREGLDPGKLFVDPELPEALREKVREDWSPKQKLLLFKEQLLKARDACGLPTASRWLQTRPAGRGTDVVELTDLLIREVEAKTGNPQRLMDLVGDGVRDNIVRMC